MNLNNFDLIKQGAEARVYKGLYLGKEAIVKERFPKKYRIQELDLSLTKERMKAETRAIEKCKTLGIVTPMLFLVDFRRRLIIMEYIENLGTLKEYLEHCSKDQMERLFLQVGNNIGKMHYRDIIHGDLTTSNMLVIKNKVDEDEVFPELAFIDFGLSHVDSSSESKAVDLYVLEKVINNTHEEAGRIFPLILNGYKQANKVGFKSVLTKYEEVRSRGRKRSMIG